MDANNRQNQSTQTPTQKSVDQNVTFGTAKKPEGFITTWKNATHLWRWRAVLCVFLSLLLTMMQPAGNALYRSWNAETGDMMGLAVALTGADLTTGGSSDITGGGEEAPEMEAAEYISKDPDEVPKTGRIYFFADWRNEAPKRDWAPMITDNANGTTVGAYTNPGYSSATVGYFYDPNRVTGAGANSNGVFSSESGYEKYGYYANDNTYVTWKESDDKVSPTAANGMMGATKLIGELSDESNSIEWNPEGSPGYWAWALGYKLNKWYGVSPSYFWNLRSGGVYGESYATPASLSKMYVLTDTTSDATLTGLGPFYTSSDPYVYAATYPTTAQKFKEVSSSINAGDMYLYAIWTKRSGADGYTLSPLYGDKQSFGNGDLTGLAWDSTVNVRDDIINGSSDSDFLTGLLDSATWAVFNFDKDSERPTKGVSIIPNNLLTQDVAFGQLINSQGLTTPDIDPWSKSSPYYDADGDGVQDSEIGTVVISPAFVITYDANGGTGGSVNAIPGYNFENELNADLAVEDSGYYNEDFYLRGATTTVDDSQVDFVSKRNATFLGWSLTPPTAEHPLDAGDVDFDTTYLATNAGTRSLYDALNDKGLNGLNEDERILYDAGYYILLDNITLYAVWKEADAAGHTVNYSLPDGWADSTITLSRDSDTLDGGKAISSLQYDTATPPNYIGPELQNANGTSYTGPKYSGEFEWSAVVQGTGAAQGINDPTPLKDETTYDVTLTPKLATYKVTVDAAHGALGEGATEILNVPYGTAYKDIYYKAGNADEGTEPDKFYFTTDTANGTPITTAATNGKGNRGQFANTSGDASATWTGLWSDYVDTQPSTKESYNITDGGTTHPTQVASLADTNATVTGPTTLTFDYDKGYNQLTLQMASAASNATTGLSGDRKTAVETAQSTSDLSLSYTTVYVPYDSWTAAGVESAANWYAQNASSPQTNYPTVACTGGTISDKYATVTDTHSNGTGTNYVAWSGFPTAEQTMPDGESRLPNSSASTTYTLTATPTLKTYDITVTVNGSSGSTVTSNGGTVTKDANGNALTNPTNSATVGTAKWGEYADTVINSNVIGGITPGNPAGYTTTGATWSPDPAATQVTNNATTYTVTLAKTLHEVTVNVDGGKINGDTGTFVVYDVPYNTKVEDIRYDKSKTKTISGNTGYQYTDASVGGDVVALDAADSAKTDLATGRNNSGSWTSTLFETNTGYATLAAAKNTDGSDDPVILGAQTLSYEFGRDDVTVEFVINGNVIPSGASDPGGTWAENGSGIITGKVPYGKTLAVATTSDGSASLAIPNPAVITITDNNQYKNDSSSKWDTTPTSSTVVAPTSGSSGSWKVTYSYNLTKRNDLSVIYKLPTEIDQANEVEFVQDATYNLVTYGSVRASVTPEPTAIRAKSGVDATMVAKKYNLAGFTWSPALDTYVNSDLSYTANITLRDYSVAYSIVNGSWGSGVNSTDGTIYHYGGTPQTSYTPSGGSATSIPMASQASSGTNSSTGDTVVPAAGYKKDGGAWEGVWEMRVSNDGKAMGDSSKTWTEWGPLQNISGTTVATPSAVDITGDTQFRLTLKRVVSVTFQSDSTSIASNGPAVPATQYYAGDTLTAPSISPSITAQTGYQKSDDSKSGHWYNKADNSEGVPTTVPDSATALTYEYALYAVHTATYHIEHGTWTNAAGYIEGANGTLVEEVFANVGVSPPASSSANSSVYNLALAWYDGTSTASGTLRSSAPSGTISTNVDYTAYYGSNKSYTYTVEFYAQNTTLSGYDKYATYTASKTGGETVEVTAAILADNTPQAKMSAPNGAFTISSVDTANYINTDLNKKETVEGNITHKIYYDRNTFSYTYVYDYDDYSKFSGLTAVEPLPDPATTANVPYGAEVTLDTAAQTNTYYTFSGWQPSYTPEGSSTATNVSVASNKFTMPAGDTTITGTWTRNNVTITLKNDDTSRGHITKNGTSSDTETITTYKYGDTLNWSAYKVEPGSGQFFSGWLDKNNSDTNIGQALPTRALAMKMDYVVAWSNKVTVVYKPDTKYNDSPIGTFTEQNSGELDPDSAIPAYDTATHGDPATAHKPGYTFQGWEWAEGGTTQTSNNTTQPKSGTTTVSLEFTPLYEGTTHSVSYDLNSGTQTTSNAAAMTAGTFTAHTGDKVWLPSTSELTRQGCTLRGYTIKVGNAEAYERPATSTGELFMIPEGSAAGNYTDLVAITAQFDTQVTFSYEKPDTMTLSSDIVSAISNASGAKGLGATVNLPSVAEGGEQKVVSQATIPTGYHFAGWETNYNALTIGKGAASFAVPGATSDAIPAGGLTVKAKWAIDQYKVSWEYPTGRNDEYDYAFTDNPSFNFENDKSIIDYNTRGASVTVPVLAGHGSAVLNEKKYTSANVDWMLKLSDGTITKINIKDITFGEPFYIATDGTLSSTATSNQFTWTDGTDLTFVGVPVIDKHTITISVTNGDMQTNPGGSSARGTTVSYVKDYGTNYSEFLPQTIAGYDFKADESHDQNSGTWATGIADPFTAGLQVLDDASYTYEFPTVKTYTVVYELSSDYTDDAGLIGLTSTGTTATWGTTYTTTSFPTLQVNSSATAPMDSSAFNAKYYTALSWVRDTSPTTAIVSGASYTYNDNQVTTNSGNTYPGDKIIKFIGTPQTKSYSISIDVRGGAFKSGVSGVGADGKLLVDANAVYGKPLASYLDSHVTDFERDSSHMSTGHWEYGGTRIDTATDTVQYTTAVYTYVFDTKRTVTLNVTDGKFKNNVEPPRVYYVPDDGTANATLANAADPDSGAYAFAGATDADRQAAARQALLLERQQASAGFEWNTTGWTSTTGGSTLVAEAHNPDGTTTTGLFNYPNVAAQISGDVTFTYAFAAKPVTVKFTQMFQKAEPDTSGTPANDYETLQVTEGSTQVNRYVNWTGTYSTTPVTVADWAGRILSDATLKGYNTTPVKVTSDPAGQYEITTFSREHWNSTDEYYLWYNRLQVSYGYNYTNPSDAPTSASSTPAGSTDPIRWGQTVKLANPLDSTYEKALDGWYLTNNAGTLSNKAAALNEDYTFTPAYTGSPTSPIAVTLYGTWGQASYPVTFANAGTGDPNDKDATFTLNSTTAAAGASVTTAPILYGNAIGANKPTVTVSFADKYSHAGWRLYIGENANYETSVDGATVGDDGIIADADLANVLVKGPNYVFKPVFKLNQITIQLQGGGHQDLPVVSPDDPFTLADSTLTVKAWTKLTVDYGTKVYLPTLSEWQHYQQNTEGAKSWMNSNGVILPFEADKYAVKAKENRAASDSAAWVSDEGNANWPTTQEYGHTFVEATENLTFQYQWADILYKVVYNAKTDGENSDIHSIIGKSTVDTLRWSDSVFDAKLSENAGETGQTVRAKLGQFSSGDNTGMDKVLYPTWEGHEFIGWQAGSSTAAAQGTFTRGQDITVSQAYRPSLAGENVYEVYLWALWSGEKKTVTFYKNDENAGEEGEATATQDIEIDVPTNLTPIADWRAFDREGFGFDGWATSRTGSVAYANKDPFTVHSTDTPEKLKLYAKWHPSTYKVRFAYFDGTPMTTFAVTGSGDDTQPYEQEMTYGQLANLTMVNIANVSASGAHNPDGDVFAGWSYKTDVFTNGQQVQDLTSEDGGVVLLTPVSAGKVKLHYVANAGTDTVTNMPATNPDTGSVITDAASAMKGYAKFTLPSGPTRDGYTFAGWQVYGAKDASGNDITGASAAGNTIYLDGTTASYIAYAQWTAAEQTAYTIVRQRQTAVGSSEYEEFYRLEGRKAPTGSWVEIGKDALASFPTQVDGYKYMPALSTTKVQVTADGQATIVLKYNLEALSITYAFTEGGLPLAGDVAGLTPFGENSTVKLTGNNAVTTLKLPTEATLPEGYQIATGYTDKWNYDSATLTLKDAPAAGEPAAVLTSTVAADSTTQYTVVGDAVLTLPIQKKQFTVTFAHDANTSWSDDSTDATKVVNNVTYGDTVDPDGAYPAGTSVGASVKPKADEGYGFGGWLYTNTDDSTDPMNGKVVDPAATQIKSNVTFTATHFESFTVTWSPGGNSASAFSHTPETDRLFNKLPSAGYLWESDGTTTPTAGLKLAAADEYATGVPLAQDGYQFVGWKATCDDSIMDTSNTAKVNGTTYGTLEALYASVPPSHDYTFTAQWDKLVQTVLFDPNVSGGAASGQYISAIQGYSGENKDLDGQDAKTPAAPTARPGYAFDYWRGYIGGKIVMLGAEVPFTFPMNKVGQNDMYTAVWKDAVIDILPEIGTYDAAGTTFTSGNGTVDQNRVMTQVKAKDTTATYTLQARPDPGYKFVRWETSVTGQDISDWYDGSITDKSNAAYGLITLEPVGGAYQEATYRAVLEPDPYQVSFENSATPGEGTVSVTYDTAAAYTLVERDQFVDTTKVLVSATPASGYTFLGWTYKTWPETVDTTTGALVTATEPVEVDTPVRTEDLGKVPIIGRTVFTAKYAAQPASLSFDKNAAAATGSIGAVTGKVTGDEVTLPSTGYTWAGHTLLGWATLDGDGHNPPASMTASEFDAYAYKAGRVGAKYTLKGGAETLYAVYLAEQGTLTFDNNAKNVDLLATHATKGLSVNANEEGVAPTVAAVGWEGGDLATQPGYVTTDATHTRVPGGAREFVGWSYDPAANPENVDGTHGGAPVWAPGSAIPVAYMPSSSADTTKTLYAIWKDKTFTVTLDPGGGTLKSGATAPAKPLQSGVRYGESVSIPALMYERHNGTFRYWLANDPDHTTVSDSTGAAASYKFAGTSDVTLTAKWAMDSSVQYKVTMQLKDENGQNLTSSAMGPYALDDTPLYGGAYENLTVTGSTSTTVTTQDTSAYFDFDGWYIFNTLKANEKVADSSAVVAAIVQMYDGRVQSSGFPVYWDSAAGNYTALFNNNTTAQNLLTLYAKKTLKSYDVSFDPNVPTGSGYAPTDVTSAGSKDTFMAKVSGETKTLADNGTYSLPGYRFLGWLTSQPTNQNAITQETFAAKLASGDAVASTYSLDTPLLKANSTKHAVALYAAWVDTDNSVTFVSAYNGSGVAADEGATTETVHATQEHKTWVSALDTVAAITTHPADSEASFAGWYTANGKRVVLGTGTGACDSVADILAVDPNLAPNADGSYDIKLYAHYTYSSARVVYNGDAGANPPTTLPATQVAAINADSTSEPTATIELHKASDYLYRKAGYHMDGWEGKGNTATYNGSDPNYYNHVWYDTDVDRTLNFDKNAAGTTVNVYPHYAANSYTVQYDYAVPEGYKSYVMTAAVPGQDASGAVTQKAGLGWSSGSVYANNLFSVADPILEGYELTGWTYTTTAGKTVTVKRGWTVENLVNAACLADPDNTALAGARFQDSTFTLKAVWTPKSYAVSYEADGGVVLGTASAPGTKTGATWASTTDAAGDNLLIEASKLSKADYSNPKWYVNAAKTVAADGTDGAGETPTFADLVYLYHRAAGHPQNGGANYALHETTPLVLYAGWEEDTATIVFTVSNAAAAFITQVSENGTVTSFTGTSTSQVVYTVGKATGAVKGKDGLTIDKVSVTVGTDVGYSVSGWTSDTGTVASAGVLTYRVLQAAHYEGGSYVAQIAGNGNAKITLRYFDMDTTGAYPTEPTATQTLTAAEFTNVQGGAAGVGDVIPAENLGAKRTTVPDGLSLDEGRLADCTVKQTGTVADVYYKRAKVDVNFKWDWPEDMPATPSELPDPYQSVYSGTDQALPPDPVAPPGYQFTGWFAGDEKITGDSIYAGGTDVDVVGKFEKLSYTVSFTGVYGEDGVAAGTKLTGDGVPTMSPESLVFATQVEYGQTLGRGIKIDLIDGAATNKVENRSLGALAGTADLKVNYDSSRCDLSWVYSQDAGTTWVSTSDPTAVVIEGNTEFRLVSSNANVISYMPGDHGAFATKVSEGTRAESVPDGYNMADYLYNMRSADSKKQKAGPAGADGLPLGQDGWVFDGWKWEYALPQGYMQYGPTEEVPNVEDLTGLTHSITLTAQWKPDTSYLKLDLDDLTPPFDVAVRASYAAGYTSPEGLQPTYDPALGNAVTLPDAKQVTREGFTLEKWVWETTNSAGDPVTYEYAPGAEFQMPGSSKKQSDNPAVTLKAVWAEDYVTINYHSTDNTKGTVTVTSETVGTWTGTVRGSTSTPAATLGGSKAQAVSGQYEFTKWTKDDPDGKALDEATGLRPDNSVAPQRVSKSDSVGRRYYDANYYATFNGVKLSVMFGVADGSASKGRITVNGAEKTLITETRQDVPYGEAPVMDGYDAAGNKLVVKAEPKGAEYETGDGRFWDYYINQGTTQPPTWVKQYSVYDPSEVKVTAAESLFLANFKDSTGQYPVKFDTRKGTGTFSTVYKAWGDANVGAGKVPRRPGYEFTGWYATPYGQTYASATDAMPGMLAAVSSTYGQLVGSDAFAQRAQTEGITLLAGWSEKSGYAVSVSANGGEFVDASGQPASTTTSVSGLKWTSTLTNRLGTPKRAGYSFVGWSTQRDGEAIASTTKYGDLAGNNDDAPGNVVLYAQWAENTYLVRYMNYPRSNSDPITRAGELSFTRELKYNDVVATTEPYNARPDDRAWDCWAVATGGSSVPNQALKGTTASWKVSDLEANNVATDSADGAYIVYGTWTNYITWTTTYVLYDDVYENPGGSPSGTTQEGPGDEFANRKAAEYLQVTDRALPGKNATPNFDKIPPGFQYNEAMTLAYNNNTYGTHYTSADEMYELLTTGASGVNFDVVVVAKTGYTLAFDMNDENTEFPNGYTHKATTGADAGNAATYPTQLVKDFYKVHNVPWSVYDRDNTEEGVALADPTRPGFAFAGWHTLVAKDTDTSVPRNDIESKVADAEELYYGDLAYDSKGNWYDPMVTSGGQMTLHARWLELQRLVRYTVASDMTQLVRIRLQSEAADAFSTDERSQIIGAATGDLFVDGVRKTRAQVPSGAVAEANRGYQVQWRIVVDDAAAQAKTYEMPFGTGMDASAMSAFEAAEAVMDAFVPASGSTVVADLSAEMVTAASGAARSTEGTMYSATDAITPGVVADENAVDYGLFAGNSIAGADDATAHDVQYVATVVENAGASITINPDGGKYTGATTVSQPYGTFIGESAPWGLADGKLPAANTISRWGYTFNGWVVPAGTKYVDSRGLTKTITSTTTLKPTDDIANRIIVPAGGITLKAAWTLNANATVKIDANGGKYPGTSSWTQPALTYIGEQEPWGSGLGALPSGDGATRWGYDFNGYIVPAGTQYTDGNATKTLDADTTVKPTDSLAKRLILPASGVTLKVAWKEKPAATVRVDANGGTYSGSASWAQPQSTYVGEKAPWGSGLGALPAANTVTRTNYRFDGWIVPAGTQYATASGAVQTLDKDTTVLPTSDMAKRIILPANGLTLKAAWTEAIIPFGDDLVISPLPDVDYTSYAVQNPAVKVTLGGKTLVAGTDYTTLYTNNVEVGTATVTVTGKGLYKGTKSATFRINHIAQKQGFVDLDRNGWYMTTDLTPGSNAGNFKGIETLYLDLVFARELMTGYRNPDGTYTRFGPDDKVTRAQAATILYRIANAGKTDTYNPSDYARSNTTGLPDVETGQYYTAAVNWAQREGVITGYGTPGHYYAFGPNDNVTREQMATMISRFCVQYYGKPNKASALSYKDGGSINSWARAGVQYCSAVGIMAGYGTSGIFGPQDNATRCQVGKIVAVAVHEVIDK